MSCWHLVFQKSLLGEEGSFETFFLVLSYVPGPEVEGEPIPTAAQTFLSLKGDDDWFSAVALASLLNRLQALPLARASRTDESIELSGYAFPQPSIALSSRTTGA